MPDFLFWLVDPHLSSSRSPAKRRADLVGCTFSGLCVELCYCCTADHIPGLSVEHFLFSLQMKMEIIKKECMACCGNSFCLTLYKKNLINLDKYFLWIAASDWKCVFEIFMHSKQGFSKTQCYEILTSLWNPNLKKNQILKALKVVVNFCRHICKPKSGSFNINWCAWFILKVFVLKKEPHCPVLEPQTVPAGHRSLTPALLQYSIASVCSDSHQ